MQSLAIPVALNVPQPFLSTSIAYSPTPPTRSTASPHRARHLSQRRLSQDFAALDSLQIAYLTSHSLGLSLSKH